MEDAEELAAPADPGLKATAVQLKDALSGATGPDPAYRKILALALRRLAMLEQQIADLHQLTAQRMRAHNDAVVRLAEMPGLGADSAQQIIAEVGPQAGAFPSAGQMASWIGVCPGREESAGTSHSDSSPKGNRAMRRVLAQAANAAVRAKGCVFQRLYQRLAPRLGHNKTIWAVAHRMACILWKILHQGVRYEERGVRTNPAAAAKRASRLFAQLRALGYDAKLIRTQELTA